MPRTKFQKRRQVLEAVRSSTREVLTNTFMILWVAALLAGGYFFYQHLHGSEISKGGIETKSVALIDALEAYHAQHEVYPKHLLDLAIDPRSSKLDFIYNGIGRAPVLTEECAETPLSDKCWSGYQDYGLLVVFDGKTFTYSSSKHQWEAKDAANAPKDKSS